MFVAKILGNGNSFINKFHFQALNTGILVA
jgi:hypothetical protein